MIESIKKTLVIPCHNEEKGLEKILRNVPLSINEVIVIDNKSTDRTTEIAKKYGATVVYERKLGYGYAYASGLSHVTGEMIITLDGDDSYPLTEINKIFTYMYQENLDFVVGSRFPLSNRNAQPLINKVGNAFSSWLIKNLFKINITDSQSGMMAFRRDVLRKIKVKSKGMGFSQEIKIRAYLSPNIKYGEIHIPYSSRIGTSKYRKVKDSIEVIRSIIELRRELIH